MPTYGYRCTACGHEFERFQKISDPPVSGCEACGETVKKILYPVGIQFKGAGFYVNDYAKSSKSSSESGASEAKAEPKSETKTEPASKPATETKAATGTT